MLTLHTTGQFRKDVKLARKRGLDISLLKSVIQTLLEEKPLAAKHKNHLLVGNYAGFRECHIQPNWLLIYIIDKGRLILTASRTGTHTDLFDKRKRQKKS
ncbi:MAG: type II toxin-antitoxin system YafQ family toxin [Spirochaetaceae bacterium]|nr:type II toxin-antitoxin system YafQ family toxin [Spirochaetaceae bacterium]